MGIDTAWLLIAETAAIAGLAIWYILRDDDDWDPAGVQIEQEERRLPEGAAYREMVERATEEIPLFKRQAEVFPDDRPRDPRSII